MMEIIFIIFAFLAGILFSKYLQKNKTESEDFFEEENEESAAESKIKITRSERPTITEQLINVMNYNGENQKEGDYEESSEADSGEDLG